MTKEEIIEIAIQAGIKYRTDEFYSEFCDGVYFDDFVTFAKLVVEKEREECAKFFTEHDTNLFWGSQVASHIRERRKE